MPRRYDTNRIDKVEALPSGARRVPATLTRSGVFTYFENGKPVREYRPPEEVAKAVTRGDFDDLPVTVGHPPAGVSPANFARESAGHVRAGSSKLEGRDVNATAIVARGDAVGRVQTKDLFDTSLGFDMRLDETPGVTSAEEGAQPYDRIQRDLVPNHVALLRRGDGRTGSAMRLDGADQAIEQDESPMKKITIRIDGRDVELEVSDASAEAVAKLAAERDAAMKRADAQAVTIATRDAADAKARRDALEAKAKPFLGEAAVFTRKDDKGADVALTDDEIRIAVIKRLDSSFDPAGKDATYVAVRFDLATAPTAAGTTSPAAPHLAVLNGNPGTQRADAAPDVNTNPAAYAATREAFNPLNVGLVNGAQ